MFHPPQPKLVDVTPYSSVMCDEQTHRTSGRGPTIIGAVQSHMRAEEVGVSSFGMQADPKQVRCRKSRGPLTGQMQE